MSVRGVGLDLVSIARVKKAMDRPGFLERILTEREREASTTPESVAGRWAAKEALFKTGCGVISFLDAEILPDESGAPRIVRPAGSFLLSITHEKEVAAAVVIWLD